MFDFKTFFKKAILPTDTASLKNFKYAFTFLMTVMFSGAVVWSLLCFAFGFYMQAIIPLFYSVFAIVILFHFFKHKDLYKVKGIAVFFSMLLPFAFQWLLGGFAQSGAVCIWALLALIGLLTCSSVKEPLMHWMYLFVALCIVSVVIEILFYDFFALPYINPRVSRGLFIINIGAVSAMLFTISAYFMGNEQTAKMSFYGQLKAIDSLVATIDYDINGFVITANQILLNLLEIEIGEIKGKHRTHLIEEDAEKQKHDIFWQSILEGTNARIEVRRYTKQGKEIWLDASFTAVFDEYGKPVKVLMFGVDITERKNQEKEMKRLSEVVSKVNNAVIITDKNGYTEWVNEAFTTLTGYQKSEIVGKKPGSLLQGKETNPETIQKIKDGLKMKAPFYVEILNYHKLGLPYWVNLNITPILDENQQILSFISVQSDISERKNAEQRIQAAYQELQKKQEIIEASIEIIDQKNKQLLQTQEMILAQNSHLEQQAKVLQKQSKDIKDSVLYAKRIQTAILDRVQLRSIFQDSFILFKPRDIVSGDFYWFATKQENGQNKAIIVAGDCTGHGVPGAFMSLIADSLLNNIVHDKETHQPAAILKCLAKGIESNLRQKETNNKDGMDVAVVMIDFNTETLYFAGAKSPLVYVQNGELQHIKGDNMPIGASQYYNKTGELQFSEHSLSISKGDIFYMMSDGYQDQISSKGKFTSRRLRNTLFELHKFEMELQKQKLEELFENFNDTKQLDDVMILGFKI
jgi:PAS domain S-box-containing protein